MLSLLHHDVTIATSRCSNCFIAMLQNQPPRVSEIQWGDSLTFLSPLYRSFFEPSIGRKFKRLQVIKFTAYRRPNLSSVEDLWFYPSKSANQRLLTLYSLYFLYFLCHSLVKLKLQPSQPMPTDERSKSRSKVYFDYALQGGRKLKLNREQR